MFFKQNEVDTIFWKLLGVSEEQITQYFQKKHKKTTNMLGTNETNQLPLSSKLAQALGQQINEKTKKLDLDILFSISFKDLSNQFVHHLYTQGSSIETIMENYKKLMKNPIITQL